jgi:hypothetical protein
MDKFENFLSNKADIPHRRIPYYLRWISKAYEIAGASLQDPLPSETETQAIRHLQQDYEKWQVNQARRALQLYRYFLTSTNNMEMTEGQSKNYSHDTQWRNLVEKTQSAMRHENKSPHMCSGTASPRICLKMATISELCRNSWAMPTSRQR